MDEQVHRRSERLIEDATVTPDTVASPLLTLAQAAAYLSVSPQTLRWWHSIGLGPQRVELPPTTRRSRGKVATRGIVRYHKATLDRFMRERETR